jgi:hypothetical protein
MIPPTSAPQWLRVPAIPPLSGIAALNAASTQSSSASLRFRATAKSAQRAHACISFSNLVPSCSTRSSSSLLVGSATIPETSYVPKLVLCPAAGFSDCVSAGWPPRSSDRPVPCSRPIRRPGAYRTPIAGALLPTPLSAVPSPVPNLHQFPVSCSFRLRPHLLPSPPDGLVEVPVTFHRPHIVVSLFQFLVVPGCVCPLQPVLFRNAPLLRAATTWELVSVEQLGREWPDLPPYREAWRKGPAPRHPHVGTGECGGQSPSIPSASAPRPPGSP